MNKSHAWLSQCYRFNALLNLWHRNEQPLTPFSGADGASEPVIKILHESFDRSSLSLELQAAVPNGAHSEDFSARRANLLRPLRHLLKGSILEIGAGSGSLTRFLGETGADVVAMDKDERRAAAAAARCAELSNVSIIVDDIGALPVGPQFDVVLLIDLMGAQRTSSGTVSDDPKADLMKQARSRLRPGGLLIVAVENQLGLGSIGEGGGSRTRESAAAAEDLLPEVSLTTFGRAELWLRLTDMGLPHQQWWFPLPDQRLPVSLLSDRVMARPVDLSGLIDAAARAERRGSAAIAGSIGRTWAPLLREGLWPDIATAFLVVSSDQALPDHDVLAVHYGAPRRQCFARELSFVWRKDHLAVQRRHLCPETPATEAGLLSQQLADEPFEIAPSWHAELEALAARPGWTLQDWTNWAKRWLDAVLASAAVSSQPPPGPRTTVSGTLLDAIPRNMIAGGEGSPRFFSQEWQMREPIELGFLVYHGLFTSLDALVSRAAPAPGVSLSKMGLFQSFVRSLGWSLTANDIRRYAEFESAIRAEVGDDDDRPLSKLHDPIVAENGLPALPLSAARKLRHEIVEARARAAQLADLLLTRNGEHQAALRHLAHIEQELWQEKQAVHDARQEIAVLVGAGDRLAWQLQRAYSRPLNPLRQGLQRSALRAILLLKPLLPSRRVRSFQHSLEKRKPTRFQREWEQVRLQAPAMQASEAAPDLDGNDIAAIESSGLFDATFYAGTASAHTMGMSPIAHYVNIGEASGLAPSADFDPVFYGSLYPTITERKLSHYVNFGRNEGRLAVPAARRMNFPAGSIDPSRPTVIVLVHEASRTGAPILAWNIVRVLRERANAVVLLQRTGVLEDAFEEAASAIVKLPAGFASYEAEYEALARAMIRHYQPDYVIANSVETRGLVPAFERNGVPVVALVHEFSTAYRPAGQLYGLFEQASQVVFPAQVVADAALTDHNRLVPRRYAVLPQGRSDVPPAATEAGMGTPQPDPRVLRRPSLPEHGDARLLPPRDGTLLVVGMGTITIRKGVDVFVSAAADVVRRRPDLAIQFAWAGEAFNFDQAYVDAVEQQIERSGLAGRFRFLGAFSDLGPLYERADVMILSSRLDPLPNVSIDSALHGIPVLCFENASGMAEILLQHAETRRLVVPYLNASAIADEVIGLATDPEWRARAAEAMRRIGESTFDMERYVDRIDTLARSALEVKRQQKRDFSVIKDAGVFNPTLYQAYDARQLGADDALEHYLLASSRAVPRGAPWSGHFLRRPMEGFNPLIYAAENEAFDEATGEDPLAHFVRTGAPLGPWTHQVITPTSDRATGGAAQQGDGAKLAIHGHFHYVDLVPEFLDRLGRNHRQADLLLTTTSDERRAEIEAILARAGRRDAVVVAVPNKGRDIGPLLSCFPREQIFSYDLIGHVHGKRSPHAANALGEVWRTFLWEHLIGGDFAMVDEIAAAFAANPKLGLVFPEDPSLSDWSDNRVIADDIAARMGIRLRTHFDFPIGTMFWARPAALAPLFDLALTWNDYPSEPLPIDGTLLHVLERMLPFAAEKAGYDYATTYVRDHRR